jgi:hydrogenase expression/formation protein HypE
MLGYDPLYIASEGRVVAVLEPVGAELALSRLKELGYADAAIIGSIISGRAQVVLETELGG